MISIWYMNIMCMNSSIGWIPPMDLLGHKTYLFIYFMYLQLDCPPKGLCQWTLLPTSGSSHFPILGSEEILSILYISAHVISRKWPLPLICISLLLGKLPWKYFLYLICFLGICISSGNCLSMFFIHFSIGLFIIFKINLWKHYIHHK